jgi:hypothetical protein
MSYTQHREKTSILNKGSDRGSEPVPFNNNLCTKISLTGRSKNDDRHPLEFFLKMISLKKQFRFKTLIDH